MKKLLLSLAVLITSGALFAQVVQGTIKRDWTVVSSNGVSKSLFSELALGKILILDVWYNECGWCKTYAPVIEQVYTAKGSGTGTIDVWGLNSNAQSDASINSYKSAQGVTNKCFGGSASQTAVSRVYFDINVGGSGSFGTPSYVVVCPNKKAWWNVNYPPTATGFDTYISQCGTSSNGVYNIIRDENQARFVSIYPNPGNSASKIDFFIAERGNVEITIFNLVGEQVGVLANETFDMGSHTLDFSAANLTAGNYMIKMITENGVADVTKLVIVK